MLAICISIKTFTVVVASGQTPGAFRNIGESYKGVLFHVIMKDYLSGLIGFLNHIIILDLDIFLLVK